MMDTEMLRPWNHEFARFWDKLQSSVGRPKPGEVEIFERLAGQTLDHGRAKVVVLGSTPELRSMLARHPVDVCLVDASPEMVEAMTEMVSPAALPREVVVIGNWLDDPLPPESCDFVFGDLVVSNIPFSLHDRFLTNVRKWLKPGGSFISRIESFKKVHRTLSYDELFAHIAGRPVTDESIAALWDGAWLVGPMRTRSIVVHEFHDGMLRRLAERPNPVVESLLERGGIVFPLDKVWYSYDEADLLDVLLEHFSVEEVAYDPSIEPIYRDFPRIYSLVKRQTSASSGCIKTDTLEAAR